MPGIVGPGNGHSPKLVNITVPVNVGFVPLNQSLVDTAIVSGTTTITYVDAGPFADPATIPGTTTVTTAELYLHPTGFWGPFDTDNGFI